MNKYIRSYTKLRRFKKANSKHFNLLFFALLIGGIVGLVSTAFRLALGYADHIRQTIYSNAGNNGFSSWLWPILFTVTGITIAKYLVRRFAPEAAGSGVQEIEGALDGIRPMRWKRVLPVKFFASILSVGSGLLLGSEGPTIQLGANIGKMVRDTFGVSKHEENPLISTGAAAGLAGAFNAPFSGIIFIIEEMQGHFKYSFYSVAAIMVGSATADFIVRAIINDEPSLSLMVYPSPNIYAIWLFILLGFICSLVGLLYNKVLIFSLDTFQTRFNFPIVFVGVFVGLVIAFAGIFYPDLIGGGHHAIFEIVDQSLLMSTLLFLFIGRLLLSFLSYSSGASGGIFLPLLTLGVILGVIYGNGMQVHFPNLISHPGIFAIAGMAGIFAAVVRAPLTGTVLAIEMTSNYELILPLIFTTATAAIFTTVFGNKPIYATLLKRTLTKAREEEEDYQK